MNVHLYTANGKCNYYWLKNTNMYIKFNLTVCRPRNYLQQLWCTVFHVHLLFQLSNTSAVAFSPFGGGNTFLLRRHWKAYNWSVGWAAIAARSQWSDVAGYCTRNGDASVTRTWVLAIIWRLSSYLLFSCISFEFSLAYLLSNFLFGFKLCPVTVVLRILPAHPVVVLQTIIAHSASTA